MPLRNLNRETAGSTSGRPVGLIVAGTFAAIGTAWVVGTDTLLQVMDLDVVLQARFDTAKGLLFVAVTSILLYAVATWSVSRVLRSRATLLTLVDSLADGLLVLGRDRKIQFVNPAATRMLGCRDPSDLVGMTAPEFSRRFRVSSPDGTLVAPERFVSQRVYDEGGVLQYKAVLFPPGLPEVVISATAAAVRDDGGQVEVVVSLMHDITATEQMEETRYRFFAAASHSLKTPLAIIQANAQILRRSDGALAGRAVQAIERQCRRMNRLVDNLLVLARSRSGTLTLHVREVDLRRLVENVLRHTSVEITREVGAVLTGAPVVLGDEQRLELALYDLIDRAARGTDRSTPITVELREEGPTARIGVRHATLLAETSGPVDLDDLRVLSRVAEIVVEAHGGELHREEHGVEGTEWMRLMTRGDLHDART